MNMPPTYRWLPVTIGALLLLFLGCGTRSEEIRIDTRNWVPGLSVWYRVQVTDSVFGPSGGEQRKLVDKAIRFTILDTSGGPTIEWSELHLLEPLNDKDATGDQREWVAMHYIVYRCHPDGTIQDVLNYPEIKSRVDTLIHVYLEGLGVLHDPEAMRIAAGFQDSAWVMTALLREADLLHRLFGSHFTPKDTLELFSLQTASEEMLQPYHLCLTNDAICRKGDVSLKGWGGTGTVDIGSFLTERMGQWDRIDSLEIPKATGHEEMTACFDTARSLPTYLSLTRAMDLNGHRLVQHVLIFLDEDWTGIADGMEQ